MTELNHIVTLYQKNSNFVVFVVATLEMVQMFCEFWNWYGIKCIDIFSNKCECFSRA